MSEVERHTMPSGQTCVYRDSDHSYWEDADETGRCTGRVAGVSTIARNSGETNADGLMDWAARLTCQGIAREFKPWEDCRWLESAVGIDQALRGSKSTWRDIRSEAGDRGNAAHKVLEQLAEGIVPPFGDGHGLAVISWWKARRPEPVLIEQVVYDHERRIAGRFDLLDNPDAPTLLDLKTGSVRNSALTQTNLYRLACRAAGFPVPERLLILDTRDDGSWSELEIPIRPEWALAALDVYNAGKAMGTSLRAAKRTAVRVPSAPPEVLA